MKRITITLLVICMLGVMVFSGCSSTDKIIIGSKDFSENIIIGELLAQLVEEHTDLKVERKLNMGGTFVCFEAIKKGQIDAYPDYTGTGLTAQLKMDVINDPDQVYKIVKEEFKKQFNLEWMDTYGFNNTYAIATTANVAKQYNLEKVSDLVGVAEKLVFGAEHEFFNRQDGFEGVEKVYGIKFKDAVKMNVALKYQAIGDGQMEATDVFTTDGQIRQYDLKVLEDDKNFFPPYYAGTVVRSETLEKHPELATVLNMLGGKISEDEMIAMNYKVDVDKIDIKVVADEFLKSKGLKK